MQEPTIGEIIRIESGYTSYVDLGLELYDDTKNIGRMERYRPIKSHRHAFQSLAKSLHTKDGRCYLLTGSYGTGKSHLCLMFANYLQTPASAPPMPAFFKNYTEVDPNEANTLQTLRANGRYLIALCQWGGKEDFDEVVLKAVDGALMRESFDEDFDTQYLQAAKKIDAWRAFAEAGQTRFADEFERELSEANAGITVNAFQKKLHGYDYEALQEFKRIHKKITTADFTFDRTNLIEILTATLSSAKFKQRFVGLLVLFDEFGDTMEHGRLSPKAFQQFAQLCADTPAHCERLVFIGTAHKNLTDYAKSYNQLDFRTASDRIKQVPLTPDGVEEIISAIVVPQKQHLHWQQYIEPRSDVFDSFGQDCTRLKLFEWLSAPKVREKIIENIYPMHPMATFSLLQLARDVASNNRSVYTFFSEEASGSYSDFIRTAPIVKGGKLNLYTADRLCDYFADTLKSDNKELRDTVREKIRDYENSLRALNQAANSDSVDSIALKGDELIQRLLRVMLVYEIIGKPNRFDNLAFGLYCGTEGERAELKNRLDALAARGILYLVKEAGVYEFKRATAVNLDAMIETWTGSPANVPQNVVADLNDLVPLEKSAQYLEAKGYNLQYSEDKQLLRRFVRAADLGTVEETPQGKRSYFRQLEEEIAASIAKKGDYEGMALYVVCESQEEIGRARDFCANNESERILVAIPRQPVPLADAIMEYRALLSIEKSEEFKNFSTQDKSAFNARLNGDLNRPGAKQALIKLRDKLLGVKEITWHGRFAQVIPTDDTRPYDAADRVMEQLYTERNTFSHDDFNKLHIKVDKKAQALKEAVEKLLDYTEQIVISTDLAQQRGDYRYLQKCLLQNGVMRQVKTDGFKLRCEFEEDPTKYRAKLPALADMVCDVRALDATGKIRIVDWLRKYRSPAYGQGPVALALGLACMRSLFRDSIRFKVDDSAVGDMPVKSLDDVMMLIEGNCPNAFLSYRPLSKAEKAVVNSVYGFFGPPGTAAAQDYTVVEAHAAMKSWWEGLPPVVKVAKLYASQTPDTATFIGVLQKVTGKDPQTFLFEELPTAFEMDGGLMVTSEVVATLQTELPKAKARLEAALSSVEERILNGVRELFGVEQDTHSDLVEGIKQWYNKLDSNQRDLTARWQNSLSRPLLHQLKTLTDIGQAFFVEIPGTSEYGNRAVRDWATDKVGEYLSQLRSGKDHIEANRIKVQPPTLEPDTGSEWLEPGKKLSYKDKTELKFKKPANGAKIYVTEGNADPTDPAAPRREIDADQPLLINENKTLRYAVQDAEGNWSPVQSVQLTNANAPYMPAIGSPDLIYQLRPVQFNLKDADSLAVACRELFRKCIQLGMMDAQQLEAAVNAALQEAKATL